MKINDQLKIQAMYARQIAGGPKLKVKVEEPTGDKIELGTDSGDQFSDKELRDVIKEVTGEYPAGRTSRETLIKRFNELNTSAE